MARPASQTIACPACGQPFNAIIEQILDAGRDPGVKERLLSGRINTIACPHCGYQGTISTPLMYHDPSKPLAIIYMPMEINLPQGQREKLIGDMTQAIMRSLPEDAPRGYLLQPRTALTIQGLVEQVLEADGITRDMIEAERRKIELIEQLIEARSDEVDALLEQNYELFDHTFFDVLTAVAQASSQSGDNRAALRLLNIRTRLLETTEAGREIKARQDALMEASQELQALGEGITREQFVDLLVRAARDPLKIEAFAALGQQVLDYSTFQLLTERIEAAETEEDKQALTGVRDFLLGVAAEIEKRSRAVIEQAVDTLRTLMQAGDVRAAIEANLSRIDQTFLTVLQANLDEARKTGNVQASSRLKEIRDEVLRLIQASAPPEIQFINALLSAGSESESLQMLYDRGAEITPELIEVMASLSEQLRAAGNEPAAERLEMIQAEAEKMLG